MTPTQQQQSGLHLLDLCRAYPRHPGAPQAVAVLETYRIRGAEARRQAELKAARAREREQELIRTVTAAAEAAQ